MWSQMAKTKPYRAEQKLQGAAEAAVPHLEEQVPDKHCLWLAWATESDIFQEWPTRAKPLKISAKVEVSPSADGAGFLVFPLIGSGNPGAPETESVHSEMEQVTGRMEERKTDSGVEAHYRLKAQIC